MTFREFTGKNVEEAIRSAMKEFDSDLSELDIEILSQGSRGILGVGGEEARILAAPRSAVAAAPSVREAAPPDEDGGAMPIAPSPEPPAAMENLDEEDAAADQAIELARAEENRRRRGGRGRSDRGASGRRRFRRRPCAIAGAARSRWSTPTRRTPAAARPP